MFADVETPTLLEVGMMKHVSGGKSVTSPSELYV